MTEIIAALIGAICGVLLSAKFSREQEKKSNQIRITNDLYWRFHDKEMIDSRIKADRILETLSKDQPKSYGELYETLDPEQWYHISRVLHFFEQAGTLHSLGHLDNELFKATTGVYFKYFYTKHIEPIQQRSIATGDDREYIKPIKYLAGLFI